MLAEPTAALVPVRARPHPLSEKAVDLEVPAGSTLAEIVDLAIPTPWLRSYAAVALEGHLIPPQHLARVRPKPGRRVTITVVPQGGGGDGGGKNTAGSILSIVVMIAAIAATAYAGPLGASLGFSTATLAGSTASAASIAGGVIIAGGTVAALMAINGPLPPRNPRRAGGA